MGILPFFHIYGLTAVMNCGLASGAKIVTLPNFKPASFLESIQKYRVSHYSLTLFLDEGVELKEFQGGRSTAREMFSGGARGDKGDLAPSNCGSARPNKWEITANHREEGTKGKGLEL